MTNDIFTLPGSTTAAQALSFLTENLKSPVYQNIIQFIFVVDSAAGQKLRGALTLRDLLIANSETRLDELMSACPITLSPDLPAHRAARRVIESGLTAVPIIDQEGRILGVVSVDTALALTAPKTGGREVFRLYT
jgi:magnesium transporter